MLFYGTSKGHSLTSKKISNAKCPSCQKHESLETVAFTQYAHLYWIPFFTLGKKKAVVCESCGYEPKDKELSSIAKEQADRLKADVNIPIWHFAGVALIAIVALIGIISSNQNSKMVKEYLANPASGDIYQLKLDSDRFTTLRIFMVTDDSLYVNFNDYESNLQALNDLDESDRYSEDIYTLHRKELETMYERGEIYNINRY
ncbi:MAG: zinc-ribbon domain-containing protein [Aureispira sp.]|nr:zinc-ribbon domain-containing protein [Aureispira sp.]